MPNISPNKPDIAAGIYRHYKGRLYEVQSPARHSETGEWLVVYRALYGDYGLWVRPAGMFFDTVVHQGQTLPRFTLIQPF